MSRESPRSTNHVPKGLVVVGAGGHGREILDVVRASRTNEGQPEWEFVGFIDTGRPNLELLKRLDAVHIGGEEALEQVIHCSYVIGIGDPDARKAMDEVCRRRGLTPASLIHATASIGSDVRLGRGLVMFPNAVVTTNVSVGEQVHLSRMTSVGHDVVLGDYVSVYPGASISGGVHVESGATIGANATINPGIRVGKGAIVGAGAVAIRDVAPSTTVVGVPAQPK